MKILLTMAFVTLAFALGMIAPDADQKTGLIVHRSILTHGPWLALIAAFLVTRTDSRQMIPLTGSAFASGLTVHLAADLFPQSWTGFALIHIPWYGRMAKTASICWILGSICISASAALYLLGRSLPREE